MLTFNQVTPLADYAPTHKWDIFFDNLPDYVTIASQDLNVRCETSGTPTMTQNAVSINMRGHKLQAPGQVEFGGNITLNFIETADGLIQRFIKELQSGARVDETGAQRSYNEQNFTVRLVPYGNDASSVVSTYTLIGCMYNTAELGEYGSEGGDAQKPSLTLFYQTFE